MSRYPSAQQLLDKAVAEAGHDNFGSGDFAQIGAEGRHRYTAEQFGLSVD